MTELLSVLLIILLIILGWTLTVTRRLRREMMRLRAHRNKQDEQALLAAEKLLAEARNEAAAVTGQARLDAESLMQRVQDTLSVERNRLSKWHYSLQAANDKLRFMKESFVATEKKAAKTIFLIRKQHPELERHTRYLRNKLEEMNRSYREASLAFSRLEDGSWDGHNGCDVQMGNDILPADKNRKQ